MSLLSKDELNEMEEADLFEFLKKINHEAEDREFKEYFNIEDLQKKADEIAAYVAGLANAGGGVLILGVPETRDGVFDQQRWKSDKPMPIAVAKPDQLRQLLEHRLPQSEDSFYLKVIPSTVHPGYCRIVIIARKQVRLVCLDSRKLSRMGKCNRSRKDHRIKSVRPVYIPLKTATALETYSVDKILNEYIPDKVRGPEFVLSILKTKVKRSFLPRPVPSDTSSEAIFLGYEITTIIQNIGDRQGYLELVTKNIEGVVNEKRIEFNFPTHEMGSAEKPFNIFLSVEGQVKKQFMFKIPYKEHVTWQNGKWILQGRQTTHTDEIREFEWKKDIPCPKLEQSI